MIDLSENKQNTNQDQPVLLTLLSAHQRRMSPGSLFMCDSALSPREVGRPVGRDIMSTRRYSNYALTISHILISLLLLSITTRFSSEKMSQVFGNNSNSAWCVE